MKVFKLVTGGLILLIVGLFFWQNIPTFVRPLDFQLNLYIKEHLKWSLKLYSLLLLTGMAGLCLGLLIMLKPYFNVRRLLAQERQERQQLAPITEPPPQVEVKSEQASHRKVEEQ
ncbi:MAG: hypothetical protein RBS57_00290 [Desulforhabdus sp.]|jgi:hypothetical protein|nr:hypothetical protein [Desulforhabdus sp.]